MKLENNLYAVEVDERSGVVTSIYDKVGELELIAEPRMGEPFRLLVPLPGQESNYVFGGDQELSRIERTESGLSLRWDGPMKSLQGSYDIQVTMFVELVEEAVHCRINVENRCEHEIAEVWYPILGGITGIGERMETKTMIHPTGRGEIVPMFQEFPESMGVGGGGGNPYPEYYVNYHGQLAMPWIDFYNESLGRGLYFCCHDESPAFGMARFEMRPGIAHNSIGDNWPRPEEVDEGVLQGVTFTWVKFPYTKRGETFESPPVVFQFHEGDWHSGARIYRKWFDRQFPLCDPNASWLHREHVYQDVMCLLPEGDLICRFDGIPQIAQDGLDYGVKALIVSSWNVGGHDNMYPLYEPDPRLGTWDDLEAAIARCHRIGVKVFFFVNLQPVDLDTDWYRDELHKYMSLDKWGVMPRSMGWGMGTLGARSGWTCRRMGIASPGFPEYRKIIVDQMRKLAEIGADGVHFDKLALHFALDFNADLRLAPSLASGEGILLAMEQTLQACREINPEFQISVEDWWDRLLEFTDVAWAWHCELDHIPSMSYTFNQWKPMMPVVQPFDYNVVNNATRYGFQIMVGSARFSKSMQDPPMRPLAAYIQEVVRIRTELEDTVYYGEFLDTLEVKVECSDNVKFNTHRNRETGKRACVLVNFGHEAEQAILSFEGNGHGAVSLYQPFEQVASANMPVAIAVKPRRLVIVVEQ